MTLIVNFLIFWSIGNNQSPSSSLYLWPVVRSVSYHTTMASSSPSDLLDQPISPPPPGQHSDFAHPPSIASKLYIAAGICLSLILIFATMRFYAKIILKKKRTWDDRKFHGRSNICQEDYSC
jgi:hypothetical protein